MEKKIQTNPGQGAIEYLLIIAVAVLIVAIVILAITGALGGGQDQTGTAQNAVFDATLLMKINSPLADTTILQIEPNNIDNTPLAYEIVTQYLDSDIYTSNNTIAISQDDLQTAYERGYFIIKIDGTDAKTLGYTYTKDTPTQEKQIHLEYISSYNITITLTKGEAISTLTITYINNTPKDATHHSTITGICPGAMFGNGTTEPCEITTCVQLQSIENQCDFSYQLMNDIDCSATNPNNPASKVSDWNNGQGFRSLCSYNTPFIGTFYGNNKKIIGLYQTSTLAIGLIGEINDSGIVRDLQVIDANIINPSTVKYGLISSTNYGLIENVFVSGIIIAKTSYVGGLIGANYNTINNNGANVYITNTYSDGRVGGLIGGIIIGDVYNSYATGSITILGNTSSQRVGGLVGMVQPNVGVRNPIISNSYSKVDITGGKYSGGIVGLITSGTTQVSLINNYSTGKITGDDITNHFGLVGALNGTNISCVNSFWDTQTSGITAVNGCGTPKTTNEMLDVATYTNITDPWDFANNPYNDTNNNDYWHISPTYNNGYPNLDGFDAPHQTQCPGNMHGNGTTQPCEITNCEQLQSISLPTIRENFTLNYELTNNIDCSMTNPQDPNFNPSGTWRDGLGFKTMGTPNAGEYVNFNGTFNGKNNSITGIYQKRNNSTNVFQGIFYVIGETGHIVNLNITDSNLNNATHVGLLATSNNGVIDNCHTTGTIKLGNDFSVAGGLFATNGQISNSIISNSSANTNIIAGTPQSSSSIGGLIGINWGTLIKQSYSKGNITINGTNKTVRIGGITGQSIDTITHEGAVTILNSYSQTNISGLGYIGGITGATGNYQTEIINSYYAGTITSNPNSSYGGISALLSPQTYCQNSFWDNEVIGITSENDCGTPKTTNEMLDVATYTNITDPWDFANNPYNDTANEDYWDIDPSYNNGYPVLEDINVESPPVIDPDEEPYQEYYLADYSISTTPLGSVRAYAIAVDSNGNTYIGGGVSNNTDFGNGVTITTQSNVHKFFIVKYNSSGIAQWVATTSTTSTPGMYQRVNSLYIGPDGNIYAAGYTGSAMDFGNGITTDYYYSNGWSENYKFFVVKYNPEGTALWATRSFNNTAGTRAADEATSIFVDTINNVYVTGNAGHDINFGGSAVITFDGAFDDFFVVKYNSSGNAVWAKSSENNSGASGRDYANSVYVDASGNVYVGGTTSSTNLDFGNGNSIINSKGGSVYGAPTDFFLAKYNGAGNSLWVKSDTNNLDEKSDSLTWVTGIGNKIFVSGTTEQKIDVGGGLSIPNAPKEQGTTFFVTEYDSGSSPKRIISAQNELEEYGRYSASRIFVDNKENLYLAGSANKQLDFGNDINWISDGSYDFFIVKYDSSLNAKTIISAESISRKSNESVSGLFVDNNENIYVLANIARDPVNVIIDFGNNVSHRSAVKYGEDFFMVNYKKHYSGSPTANYIPIKNCEELQAINEAPNLNYKLVSDIDCTITNTWNEDYFGDGIYQATGFIPIGDQTTKFTGILDGKGHTITNLYIKRDGPYSNGTDQGLFGVTDNAIVRNLGLESASISGSDSVGGLIGTANNTKISQVYVKGNISSDYYSGGIVGNLNNSQITDSYSNVNITGYNYLGGISASMNQSASITRTYTKGIITQTGDMSSAGGITSSGKNINNSYSVIEINKEQTNNPSGITSTSNPNVTNSYWDKTITKQSACYPNETTGCTATSNQETLYYGDNGIPFTQLNWSKNTWKANANSHPTLAWE